MDTFTKDIFDKLNELEKSLIRIEDKLINKDKEIEELKKIINGGNGRKGLINQINELEKFEAKIIGIAIAGTFIANYLFKLVSK